jgi:hypothetical protein
MMDNPFSDTLLGVLLGLSLKSAFDHFFAGVDAMMWLTTVFHLIDKHPALFALRLFQLLVFLFMLSRFYLGAYRYSKVAPSETPGQTIVDTIGVLFLFSGFYLASIVVKNTDLFYWAIVAFLIVDLAWFVIAGSESLRHLGKPIKLVTRLWIGFDLLTILFIIVSMWLLSEFSAEWTALSAILVISVVDICWLRYFYFGDKNWVQNTRWIEN